MGGFFQDTAKSLIAKALDRYAPPEIVMALKYYRTPSSPALAKRKIFIANTLARESVLVLSPHPDDEAIGMGGTLSGYLANGSKVTVLYMTDGGGVGKSRAELIEARFKEAQAIGHTYGINQIFWSQPDTHLTNSRQIVTEMVKVLKNVKASCVYLPSFMEHHFDHFAANQIFVDALRELPSISTTVFGYEVWDNIPYPNYIMDISEYFEAKKQILGHYPTPLKDTDYIKLVEHRDALHYMLYIDSRRARAQSGYAEAFYRFESSLYERLFAQYVELLKECHNPLISHLQPSTIAPDPTEAI